MAETSLHHANTCSACGVGFAADAGASPEEAAALKCAACAAKLPGEGGAATPAALAIRIGGAVIYLAVCVAATYYSIPFFTSGDWWFGLMGFGLAVISLLGIKESLVPSEWHPE